MNPLCLDITPTGFITWLLIAGASVIFVAIVAGVVMGVVDDLRNDAKENDR